MFLDVPLDVLKIIYSDGDPSPANRAWLDQCMSHLGSAEWPLLKFFDPAFTPGGHSRREWLAELGLAEGAGVEEIRAAYRARAQDYHPDKLAGVPPQIRALAEAKMASINAAYRHLAGAAVTDGVSLHLRGPDGSGSFRPAEGAEFLCQCWLCGKVNRVPDRARPETCRCGSCHALVALRFDPAAS